MSLPSLLRTILKGYLNSGRNFIAVILFLIFAGLISFGIIYPLWYFATSHPRAYTLTCAILLIGASAAWMFRRLLSRRNRGGGEKEAPNRPRRHRKWRKIGGGVIILLIYLTLRLFGMGLLVPGILSLIIFLFLAGWLLYGPQKT